MGKHFLMGFAVVFVMAYALLGALLDTHAPSAGEAKRGKRFWATNYLGVLGKDGSMGMALDALDDAGIFSEFYPGYESARGDGALWRSYFARDFDFDVFTPTLNREKTVPMGIYLSWLGCLDLHRRHGADIVYMGSSETFRDIVPARIAMGLNGGGRGLKDGVKVLPCATGAMTIREAQFTAEHLRGEGRRPRWILWGFSFWSVYTKYLTDSARRDAMNRLAFESSFELSRIFPRVTWDVLFPMSYKALLEARNNARQRYVSESGPAALGEYVVPTALANDPAAVDAIAAGYKPHQGALSEIGPGDCELGAVGKTVDAAIASMLVAADNLLIYIPPTTPLHYAAAPSCLLPAVRSLLLKRRSPRVQVLVDDWKAYGLDYSDYLYASMNPRYLRIDENHTSYKGALKVSDRITAVIKTHDGGGAR